MPYDPAIPQPGDFLSDSQGQILSNFSSANTTFGINHIAFDVALDNGKHKFLQMPEQVAAPVTAVNEAGFYSKVGTSPAETNLFFRAENSGGGGGFEYQLTKAISASTALFSTNTIYQVTPQMKGGWTFLPGGLILQYGLAAIPIGGGNNTILFPIAFPTAVFSVINTGFTTGTSTNTTLINSVTLTNFVIRNTASATVTMMYWIAIGN